MPVVPSILFVWACGLCFLFIRLAGIFGFCGLFPRLRFSALRQRRLLPNRLYRTLRRRFSFGLCAAFGLLYRFAVTLWRPFRLRYTLRLYYSWFVGLRGALWRHYPFRLFHRPVHNGLPVGFACTFGQWWLYLHRFRCSLFYGFFGSAVSLWYIFSFLYPFRRRFWPCIAFLPHIGPVNPNPVSFHPHTGFVGFVYGNRVKCFTCTFFCLFSFRPGIIRYPSVSVGAGIADGR